MIPFGDLRLQYQSIKSEIDGAVARVLERGWFVLGEEVAAFEEEFAEYCGVSHCIGVSSGTDAIHLALRAVGVGPGSEVVTVANAGVPGVTAIELAGGTPVFVDVEPDTLNMDSRRIEGVLNPRTRAILAVHLYGHPADLDPILEIARRYDLAVVEDAAQAHGARYKGRRVGSIGTIGVFSFYPTKNLGAYGDGGALVTDDSDLARRLGLLRQYGWKPQYYSILRGTNSRLDELQAAILRVKLRHLDEWNISRRRLAGRYEKTLADSSLRLPEIKAYADHVFYLYVARSIRRDALRDYLQQAEIGTAVHYEIPAHLQPAYADLGGQPGDFPITEQAASEVLSLPLYPELTDEQVATVCTAIRSYEAEHGKG